MMRKYVGDLGHPKPGDPDVRATLYTKSNQKERVFEIYTNSSVLNTGLIIRVVLVFQGELGITMVTSLFIALSSEPTELWGVL